MNRILNAKAAVAIVLLSLVAFLGFLIHEIPRDIGRGPGAFLVVVGLFNLLLYRRHARQIFEWSLPKSTKLLHFWSGLGKSGVEFLFLGIALVITISGVVLWIRGVQLNH
jgi:hypothetical protein